MVSKRSFAQWVFLIGLQLLNSSAWGGTGPFVYAASWGNADPASISAYRVGTSGALVPVQGSPFATGDTPTSLTVCPEVFGLTLSTEALGRSAQSQVRHSRSDGIRRP